MGETTDEGGAAGCLIFTRKNSPFSSFCGPTSLSVSSCTNGHQSPRKTSLFNPTRVALSSLLSYAVRRRSRHHGQLVRVKFARFGPRLALSDRACAESLTKKVNVIGSWTERGGLSVAFSSPATRDDDVCVILKEKDPWRVSRLIPPFKLQIGRESRIGSPS